MGRVDEELSALIAVTEGTLPETRGTLEGLDLRRVAWHLLREIAERTTHTPPPDQRTAVQIELTMPAAESYDFVLTVGADGPEISEGRDEKAPVRISQDFAEMARALYGSANAEHDTTRKVWILDEPGPASDDVDDPWRLRVRAATTAAGQVLDSLSSTRADLGALARHFGSDKWGIHFYTPHYENHFERYRDRRVNLLEIGIGGYENPCRGGESLRMWREYFRRGLVYGLDLHEKSALDRPRITTIQGDQSDVELLESIAREVGPLDIVIDDGSHVNDHVLTSFMVLFPLLESGGMYVIEDLQTAYWPRWNGGRAEDDRATTTGFLKTLIDSLHHQDRPMPSSHMPIEIEQQIQALHLYHNIVFIEKGLNAEQEAPSWIRG